MNVSLESATKVDDQVKHLQYFLQQSISLVAKIDLSEEEDADLLLNILLATLEVFCTTINCLINETVKESRLDITIILFLCWQHIDLFADGEHQDGNTFYGHVVD